MDLDLHLSTAEAQLGFAVQTLAYPETYELPRLGDDQGVRLERAVALTIDDCNRVKRRRFGEGYVHEKLTAAGWEVAACFANLEELKQSGIYGEYRRRSAPPEADAGDETL